MRHLVYLRAVLWLAVVCATLAAPVSLAAQRGAITMPINLEQMVERSGSIVHGTVTSARVERHPDLPNLWTVVVTLRVQQTLKGEPAQTLTFRQYIWDIRDRYDAAGYRKGHEMVLLLSAPSRYGLSSPVGLEQGRFRVLRDRSGEKVAVNGHGNAGLFQGVEAEERSKHLSQPAARVLTQERSGPIAVRTFTELLQQMARPVP